ncbi:MAG: response regulator [Desulfobacterales bacterium]|nr:response regulator [Desulfobacterales bacterium]MCF8078698.1 response regulator [Desulfobacterales bacterium]
MMDPVVLLVDDEVAFVETLAKRLERRNLTILTAFNGEESLEALQKNDNIEVVVLDVKMPGLDGVETLKRIKKQTPLVEVIMLTGHATIESAIEGMKQGALDYLMKPCDIDHLVSTVKEASQKKRAQEKKIEEAKKQETLAKYGPFHYV